VLKAERDARLDRAKALGRIAYRMILRASEIEGVLAWDGEDKRLRKFADGALVLKLWEPFRPKAPRTEFSSIQILYGDLKVFEIRWDDAGHVKVVVYKPGDWEGALRNVARWRTNPSGERAR
jgi:hypothetical protein